MQPALSAQVKEEEKKAEISALQTQISLLESRIKQLSQKWQETLSASSVSRKEVAQLKQDLAATLKSSCDAAIAKWQALAEADLDSAINTTKDAIDELAAVGADQSSRVSLEDAELLQFAGTFWCGT